MGWGILGIDDPGPSFSALRASRHMRQAAQGRSHGEAWRDYLSVSGVPSGLWIVRAHMGSSVKGLDSISASTWPL